MNFEEWYAKLSEWAEENTALNMSYAMQRHLARRLEEWESSRPTKRALDAAKPALKTNFTKQDVLDAIEVIFNTPRK